MSGSWLPDAYFGPVSDDRPAVEPDADPDPDDEELPKTPPDVVAVLGFDPLTDEGFHPIEEARDDSGLDADALDDLLDRLMRLEWRLQDLEEGPPEEDDLRADDAGWDESKHPRAKDGKFGSGGGSSSASKAVKPETSHLTDAQRKANAEHDEAVRKAAEDDED